jgi:hypothetical protein
MPQEQQQENKAPTRQSPTSGTIEERSGDSISRLAWALVVKYGPSNCTKVFCFFSEQTNDVGQMFRVGAEDVDIEGRCSAGGELGLSSVNAGTFFSP